MTAVAFQDFAQPYEANVGKVPSNSEPGRLPFHILSHTLTMTKCCRNIFKAVLRLQLNQDIHFVSEEKHSINEIYQATLADKFLVMKVNTPVLPLRNHDLDKTVKHLTGSDRGKHKYQLQKLSKKKQQTNRMRTYLKVHNNT